MQKLNNAIYYSSSDITNFLHCEYLTHLDRINLDEPLPKAPYDDYTKLLQEKGFALERGYRDQIQRTGQGITLINTTEGNVEDQAWLTTEAMRQGHRYIYQATFLTGPFLGHADFVRRVDRPSSLGSYGYEVVDTKLALTPKASYVIQLCFYSDLLGLAQGSSPSMMHLSLGDGTERNFRVDDYSRYYRSVKRRFLEFLDSGFSGVYPEKCEHCSLCRWRQLCDAQWRKDDHLNQIANITHLQIRKLNEAGIATLEQLALLGEGSRIPRLAEETSARLRHQAALQLHKRNTGESIVEVLPVDPAACRGFLRLPQPDEGDVFFDMEGDPLEEGGLEYLFGIYFRDNGVFTFKDYWAHNKHEERSAFETVVDFLAARKKRFPGMHIYHYAHYEETALKRLMSLHGSREAEVDEILRTGTLVDLYKVVREGLRVSEEAYSIKNLEVFYMAGRQGEVTDANASTVYYEKWRATGDQSLLDRIRDYNEEDCRSLYLLREWLLTLRPAGLPWFQRQSQGDGNSSKSEAAKEREERLADYEASLTGALPEDRLAWSERDHLRELAYFLLDFHRREAKPEWWKMFSRQEMSEEDLLEDPECIAMIELERRFPPQPVKRSFIYTYSYPEQEFKMKAGDECYRAADLMRLGTIESIDDDSRLLRIKMSGRSGPPPKRTSIIPGGPIDSRVLVKSLFRFADSLISNDGRYKALTSLLVKDLPAIEGKEPEEPIVTVSGELISQAVDAVARMNASYLFVQGPPGSGKTYTGSHIVAGLLRRGYKVGVSSNSHKAINNLLRAIEERAKEANLSFAGAKKSVEGMDDTLMRGEIIEDVFRNPDICLGDYDLVAGTAWLFADEDMDGRLDYLFVDEAGQVSLANLIAMGTSAKNIVLLGDQMQLGQPIQGVHPGRSGESALEFLLDGKATVGPAEGIFLPTTWRLHQDVCRFISDAVYDGRLQPEPLNQNQRLILGDGHHPGLRPTGIRFICAEHEGCSQKSDVEASIVRDLYVNLLEQSYQDRDRRCRPIGKENILVVSPYNMQVNLLKSRLPAGARVGTVDKFQGQEAEVVIVSMATSNGDCLPRHIEFLYDKNRLNVAISRAKCLAVLVANPELMAIRCNTVEQIGLVNTLCWAHEYSQSCDSGFL